MASLKERVTSTVDRLRTRYGWFDHSLKMLAHYGAANGNAQAGAVTYFGFLSVFPILALAAFATGLVAKVYPDIRPQVTAQINTFLPGVVGSGPGKIDLATMGGGYGSLAGILGLLGLLYAGLGWLSGLRKALEEMFVVPRAEQASFALGKARDLVTLLLIGAVLLVSVVLSSAVTSFSGALLRLVGLSAAATLPAILLSVTGHVLAIAVSTVLLLAMFKLLLVESHVPRRGLVHGALLGAIGFEILKLGANLLIGLTKGNAAFATFGVALILLVWINYFSRLVMYAAAWAYTSPGALARRTAEAMRAPGAALVDTPVAVEATESTAPHRPVGGPSEEPPRGRPWLVAGLVAAAIAVGVAVRGARR